MLPEAARGDLERAGAAVRRALRARRPLRVLPRGRARRRRRHERRRADQGPNSIDIKDLGQGLGTSFETAFVGQLWR